jgi:hypothetical protein
MLDNLKEETFARQLHTKFMLHPEPERTLELELIEVSSDGQRKTPGGESFSMVFRGPADPSLPQRTYRMEHGELGAFDLFIVPIRRDQDGLYYEAIINRLTR